MKTDSFVPILQFLPAEFTEVGVGVMSFFAAGRATMDRFGVWYLGKFY